jgi:hypothetical protein
MYQLLKYRYLEKIKKRKHREERETQGSSTWCAPSSSHRCRDELSLEDMATEEPKMSCVSKHSRKKHKTSGVHGGETAGGAVAKIKE